MLQEDHLLISYGVWRRGKISLLEKGEWKPVGFRSTIEQLKDNVVDAHLSQSLMHFMQRFLTENGVHFLRSFPENTSLILAPQSP